jgi:hexulose-6-phosphate isomerase
VNPLGIMQGRLVPPEGGEIQAFPRDGWAREPAFAADAGLDLIEWIDDVHGEDVNPLLDDQGLATIRALCAETGVAVRSLCADWFQANPLTRGTDEQRAERAERLRFVLDRCARAGVQRIVLPFVDNSSPRDEEERRRLPQALRDALPHARAHGIELHVESDFAPADLADLLAQCDDPLVRVNYDSGNSASLGYDVRDELAAYGERIGSVHVKDRVRGGTTVPLGEGDADLPALFAGLARLDYDGDVILQVARGPEGDEIAWARANREHVERLIGEAA